MKRGELILLRNKKGGGRDENLGRVDSASVEWRGTRGMTRTGGEEETKCSAGGRRRKELGKEASHRRSLGQRHLDTLRYIAVQPQDNCMIIISYTDPIPQCCTYVVPRSRTRTALVPSPFTVPHVPAPNDEWIGGWTSTVAVLAVLAGQSPDTQKQGVAMPRLKGTSPAWPGNPETHRGRSLGGRATCRNIRGRHARMLQILWDVLRTVFAIRHVSGEG